MAEIIRVRTLIAAVTLLVSSAANAQSLECRNDNEQITEVGFFNHWGKIVFQLSAPYYDQYLYVLGNCYSEDEVGLPYDCEAAPTPDSEFVDVNLLEGKSGEPVAEIITKFNDGTTGTELIPCEVVQ